jgi:hypothetical protein
VRLINSHFLPQSRSAKARKVRKVTEKEKNPQQSAFRQLAYQFHRVSAIDEISLPILTNRKSPCLGRKNEINRKSPIVNHSFVLSFFHYFRYIVPSFCRFLPLPTVFILHSSLLVLHLFNTSPKGIS